MKRFAGLLLTPALVVLALAGCSSSATNVTTTTSSTTSADAVTTTTAPAQAVKTIDIQYAGGKVTTADPRPVIKKGESVKIVVTSDVADEAHLHGYDNEVELRAGQPATVEFVANIAGQFEFELHKANKVLATLQVQG